MQAFPLRLVTHSGTFHCDDAFAYAILRLALGLRHTDTDHTLTRTRDPERIAAADIVWDVGTLHDPATGRFDHHQRDAPVRSDTAIPYRAAGLIWQVHGRAAVRALLPPHEAEAADAVAAVIDDEVIRRIDAIDTGVAHPDDTLGLSSVVEDFNPPWDASAVGDSAAEDAAFMRAALVMEHFLIRRVDRVRARLSAERVVLAAHEQAADPRILELERKMPWQETVFARGLPTLYCVYPVPTGNWMVDAMVSQPGSYEQRLPLPELWAGLHQTRLATVSGIADAVFVHPRRFIAAAGSHGGAMKMAAASIALASR